MPSVHETLTEQFRKWEIRGRGWRVFNEPVYPEPPFRPFIGYSPFQRQAVDDGRRPTVLSSFARKLSQKITKEPPGSPPEEPEEEPEPEPLIRDTLVEFQAMLPAKLDIPADLFAHFLRSLSACREPVSFELLGLQGRVTSQFAAHLDDAPLLRRQLQAFFPEALFQQTEGELEKSWLACKGIEALAVEFGLEREFMFPLASGKIDPFIAIIGALSELGPAELGLFQVIFQCAESPWATSIINSVRAPDHRPIFVNARELAEAAEAKASQALYAAVVRLAIQTESWKRTLQLAQDLAASLRVFADPEGNALIPLTNEHYPYDDHVEDVLRRQSRRSGMLLGTEELIGFVHLPTSAVRSPVLRRDAGKTKEPPFSVRGDTGVLLGHNVHMGKSIPVRLTPEQRVRHTHIIGASGTGKSTLLFNLIRQDIENGEGVAVLDPHGDLVDRILEIIPPNRIGDVVLVDPSDEEYSIGFNILSAHSDLEKNLLASDLVSVFQRLSTSWGDQMGSVLNNAVLAFLESSRRGTLADLRRFLVEPSFRSEFLKSVSDPALLYYWHKGFPQLAGNKSIGPAITRLDTFLSPKPIRYMVSQPENRLDFSEIMDSGKIFLAKLSQGLLGRENSYLLGTLLVSKFQQLAMARQAKQVAVRRNFWLYMDEFHNFITPSMAEILAGARKYRVGLILAHQELRQLQRDSEVSSAVMSNPYTRIVFRVGDDDARKLGDGFGFFEARDLQNLETGNAIVRVERSDFDFNLTIPMPDEQELSVAAERRGHVISASRSKYALNRADIEATLKQASDFGLATQKPTGKLNLSLTPQKEAPEPPASPSPKQDIADSVAQPSNEDPVLAPLALLPAPPPVEPVPPSAPTPAVERKGSTRPTDLGRGGAQHQAIQKRIKQTAQKLGFKSTIEKPVLDGEGSIDLFLEREDQVIACEISISTTIDHEVGNVVKCLKAGIPKIAVICVDKERLSKIAAAVLASLGPEPAARVVYLAPDDFIAFLEQLPPPQPPTPAGPQIRRGYKVTRKVAKLAPEEQRQRDEAAVRSITEAMRRKQ